MKRFGKSIIELAASLIVLPLALVSAFGRFSVGFQFGAQAVALVPGLLGDFLRASYYRWTLPSFGVNSRIQFGSYFAHPTARVGNGVYIGSYCILGKANIGDRTQIASGIQILSGRRQHAREADGGISGSALGAFSEVQIGQNCWIGAGAIVMADVGDGSTVGAGAVVVKPVNPGTTVVGNPAKPLSVARP